MANNTTALFFDVFARDRTRGTFAKIGKSTDTLGGKIAQFGKIAAGVAAAGAVAFATQGVRSFIQFDDKMNQSLAIMGEVSGPMRKRMEDAARAVGKTTRFGADQAAEAYFFLASAGLDAEQSIGAMPQVAKFAQAGMFDLAQATDLATDAQSALGLAVDDPARNLKNLTRVTDVLVKANTLANASVSQFSEALTNKAGAAMRSLNIDLEQGTAVLAVFADQGLKGSEAGTTFNAVIRGLTQGVQRNADAWSKHGISVFDSQGNMRNLADIVADMESALGGMSVEQQRATLAQLGFTEETLAGTLALLGNSDAIRAYEQDLRNAAGTTDEVAGKQLESFAAKLDLIQSRVADFGMVVGEQLVNAAFNIGETVGEMVSIFQQLPGPAQASIGAVAGIVAAAPLAIGSWRKIRATIKSVQLAYAGMSATARVATLSLGAVGLALAAGATILAFFARSNINAEQDVDSLRESLDRQTGAITDNTRAVAAKKLQEDGLFEDAQRLGISLDTLTDAYLGNEDAIRVVQQRTKEMHSDQTTLGSVFDREGRRINTAIRNVNDAISDGNEVTSQAQSEQTQLADAMGETGEAEDEVAAAAEVATGQIEEQTSAIDELISELDQMVSAVFKARDAEVDYEQALDDATDAVKENGATLDINTQKGRDNRRELDRLAEAALRDAEATLEDAEAKGNLAVGHQQATEKMQRAREEFVKVARQMGLSKKEAEKLADELGLIPGNYKATVTADTGPARGAVRDFKVWASRQEIRLPVGAAGQFQAFASGGSARRGATAIVGEEGPELVRFGQNAQVFNAATTERMLRNAMRIGPSRTSASSGGATRQGPAVIELRVDGTRASQFFAMMLRDSLRTNPTLRAEVRAT